MSSSLIIPRHVAEKAAARAETCGNCRWQNRPQGPQADHECRRHPPTASLNLVPMQQGPVARPMQAGMAGMQLQAFSLYPIVQVDQWCGEWQPLASAVQ